MNDQIKTLQRVLLDPATGQEEVIGNLLTAYPYVHALHMLQGDRRLENRGIFSHPLWDEAQLSDSTEISPAPIIDASLDPDDSEERVSVYHDDHLPYSFLWWLNKTRLDYAHTYKPYASGAMNADKAPRKPSFPAFDPKEHEILDQQIRENIFYLQDPEEKLSKQVTAPIPFQVPKKSDPVIDRFIQEEPKISPPRPEKLSFENKARKSASDQGTVVTETLAKIYEEQGLYPKALEVYEKLSLKFPEKSAYFADRIEDLKNKLT